MAVTQNGDGNPIGTKPENKGVDMSHSSFSAKPLWAIAALISALALASCGHKTVEVDQVKLAMFKPLPASTASASNPANDAKIELGRMLYYDARLSKGQDVSCNTCHQLDKYGVDGEPVSDGFAHQKGTRNSPTVYNAAGHIAQFWDGRAPTVEEQAKGPMLNPVEMAMPDAQHVGEVLKSIPGYVPLFRNAFPEDKDPVTLNNAALAIGAFERNLVTPSRWDKFLEGDKSALTDAEKAGFLKFSEAGCGACHMGTLVGGTMFQKAGLVEPWPDQADSGRYAVTKNEADRMVFKVPSLRNVAETAPYFHDGKTANLGAAVRTMAECQLGTKLTDQDVASIVTWLKSLTGEVPKDYIAKPELPPSGPTTPKPITTG
jgi:cytochrome c peroxidase